MAIDFPTATTVGQTYTDPTSGNTYVVTVVGPPAQWVGSGSSTSLDNTYLRKDASNDPVTGTLAVTPSTNVEGLVVTQGVTQTTTALRITNAGSGNSLVIEDSASTDSTPIVADSTGRLLIGSSTTTSSALLQVAGDAQVQSLNGGPLDGSRNRVINGAMMISERWGLAGRVIPLTTSDYTLDRWGAQATVAGRLRVQQNGGATAPPVGFSDYLRVDTQSPHSSIASDYFSLFQPVEGYNVVDLAWGTASAKTVTLSFWARSSLTGTHSGSFANSGGARTYVFTFSINSANTWEYKTITVPGDTTGSWGFSNDVGLIFRYDLGSGSSYRGTAGSWSSNNFTGATGAVSIVGTTGAFLDITGVQLEAGTIATPFVYRNYTEEMMMCQRYYGRYSVGSGGGSSAAGYYASTIFRTPMRVAPTCTVLSNVAGTLSSFANTTTDYTLTVHQSSAGATASTYASTFSASSEL